MCRSLHSLWRKQEPHKRPQKSIFKKFQGTPTFCPGFFTFLKEPGHSHGPRGLYSSDCLVRGVTSLTVVCRCKLGYSNTPGNCGDCPGHPLCITQYCSRGSAQGRKQRSSWLNHVSGCSLTYVKIKCGVLIIVGCFKRRFRTNRKRRRQRCVTLTCYGIV